MDRLGAAARRHRRRHPDRRHRGGRHAAARGAPAPRPAIPPARFRPESAVLDRYDELRAGGDDALARGRRDPAPRAGRARRVGAALHAFRRVIPFVPDTLPDEPAWGIRAFGVDTTAYRRPHERTGTWDGSRPKRSTGAPCSKSPWARTPRARSGRSSSSLLDPARPPVVVLDDDTAHTGTTDSLTVGRAVPGGTYQWFFPTGTTAAVSGQAERRGATRPVARRRGVGERGRRAPAGRGHAAAGRRGRLGAAATPNRGG